MVSWVAMERIFERQMTCRMPSYRKQAAERPLRSDAKRLTDGDLLAKLRSFGIEIDRPSLERLCEPGAVGRRDRQPLMDQRTFHGKREDLESDWIWICLAALWQRWFPDKPSFEALDDKMQAGYELLESAAPWRPAACGWRRGETCCASWTRPACGRLKSSMTDSAGANPCLTGFRIWKTNCGMQGWMTGSSSPPGSRFAKRDCGVFAPMMSC